MLESSRQARFIVITIVNYQKLLLRFLKSNLRPLFLPKISETRLDCLKYNELGLQNSLSKFFRFMDPFLRNNFSEFIFKPNNVEFSIISKSFSLSRNLYLRLLRRSLSVTLYMFHEVQQDVRIYIPGGRLWRTNKAKY